MRLLLGLYRFVPTLYAHFLSYSSLRSPQAPLDAIDPHRATFCGHIHTLRGRCVRCRVPPLWMCTTADHPLGLIRTEMSSISRSQGAVGAFLGWIPTTGSYGTAHPGSNSGSFRKTSKVSSVWISLIGRLHVENLYYAIPRDPSLQSPYETSNETDPLLQFRLLTVTYGFAPVRVLIQLTDDHIQEYSAATGAVTHDTYVDDIPTECDSIEELFLLKDELIIKWEI